jgi:Bacterial protein of unknown function (DUF839)
VQNPFATSAAASNIRWLSRIPAVSHEGLRFDKSGALYFIDESNTGSIYKYVPKVKGNLGVGQSFVLRVTGYTGSASGNFDNSNSSRVGPATWVPITDVDGNKVTTANPFEFNTSVSTGGRAAADEVLGTPYGRPEDIAISTLQNGTEVLYFAATSEHAVYSVALLSNTSADVKVFCDRSTVNIATGLPVGSAFTNPDNMAIDADGKIYVVEDQPPPVADIFQAIDANNDGVAEYLARWLGLGVDGSEPTGLFFHPNILTRAILAIQHPSSGNDAVFEINFGPSPAPAPAPAPAPVPAPVPVRAPVVAPVKAQNLPILNATTALNASKATLPIGGIAEDTLPFDMPTGYTYRKITDRRTLNASGSFPIGFSSFDMITYASTEPSVPGQYPNADRFIFIPMETSAGGLIRYDNVNGTYLILAQGNSSIPRNVNPLTFDVTKDNFVSTDPCTYTPFDTILFAEETTGT